MKTKLFLLLSIVALLISCTDSKPEEAKLFDQKMTETIDIHDEVMPKMSKINELLSQLETQMDSTNVDKIKPVKEDLKTGHDKMMAWMKSFGDEFTKTEINKGIQIKDIDSLKQRLDAINKSYDEAEDMRNHMQEAIQKAEALVE